MNILISAYACEPNKGSEPGVGWNFVTQIAQFHEVWVITRANNRGIIEEEINNRPNSNIHWIFFDLPHWLTFWKKGNRGIRLYYYLWQIGAYFRAKKLITKINFDIVHHITFVNYWLPSFLPLLGLPFIWGPVGGGESCPKNFRNNLGIKFWIFEITRSIVRWTGEHDFFVRLSAKRARLALATTKETEGKLKRLGVRNTQICSQVALSNLEIVRLNKNQPPNSARIKFLSIGRLISWKGFHLSLKAFKKFDEKYSNSEYIIIGTGSELKTLKKIAAENNIEQNVKFKGNVPRDAVFTAFSESNVFIQPSLHDSGGFVSVEAMAAGLPVICLDLGGPALQVTQETGFKIPAISPQQVVDAIAEAMLKLAQDPELRKRMGAAGRKRVEEHFNWDKKGEFINQIYQEVLANQ